MSEHAPTTCPLPVPVGGKRWDNGISETGRCVNTDPLLDRVDLGIEGSGPMHIVPTAHSTVSNTPETAYAERMARADGCPTSCGNVALPNIVTDKPGGFRAHYTCESCGHDWFTSWRD